MNFFQSKRNVTLHIARLHKIFRQSKPIFKSATSRPCVLSEHQRLRNDAIPMTTWSCTTENNRTFNLEKSIEEELKSDSRSTLFEKLEEADHSSLLGLPKRIWGSVFYSFNERKEFEKLDWVRAKTKDLNINCGEGAYSTLIKSYVTRKQAIDAVNLLDEMKNTGLLRHTRTYFPVITCLAENNHQKRAFDLFDEMQHHTFKSNKSISLSIPPKMAVALIKSCIQSEAANYEKAKHVLLWYSRNGRPLTLEILNAIVEWLNSDPLYKWTTMKCEISEEGLCSNCEEYLNSGQLMLNEAEKLKLDILNTIENKLKLEKKASKRERFHKYATFLKQCTPCDVIIDGMSIGLSSNVQKRTKRFNFKTLLKVSDHFTQEGKKVMIVLNTSISPSFLSKDVEYFVTNVGYDDLFIMYACATWNMLPLVVTRDKFREHRCLLAFHNHASYLKWIRSHTIKVGVERNTLTFHEQKYDPVVQTRNASWHFPLVNGRWFCARQMT